MLEAPKEPNTSQESSRNQTDDGNLDDLLRELRVLMQGAQLLTAFLIILPFNAEFAHLPPVSKWVYIATFLCAITSLVVLSTPAAQHRLQGHLAGQARVRFKQFATRMVILGSAALSLALILATHFVVTQVVGDLLGLSIAASVALLIGLLWWFLPLAYTPKQCS
jgi:Family of unknown function (DUF6328)